MTMQSLKRIANIYTYTIYNLRSRAYRTAYNQVGRLEWNLEYMAYSPVFVPLPHQTIHLASLKRASATNTLFREAIAQCN